MEFPDLGKHCSDPTCRQLDFLPVQCDACNKIFCSTHYQYSKHNCPESYKKDNQVPVCPLCNSPVPVMPGESPDLVVGRHIDNDCQSETAQSRRKVFSNKCSVRGCKQKELMPLVCKQCRRNFCLRHRNELDHQCAGFEGTGREISSAGAAALARVGANQSNPPKDSPTSTRTTNGMLRPTAMQVHALQQPGLTEEEALRRAMEQSLQTNVASSAQSSSDVVDKKTQEENDAALARALHESEMNQRTSASHSTGRQNSNNNSANKSCAVS